MEVPREVINKWQAVWQQICDMAYHRKNLSSKIIVDRIGYSELMKYTINSENFDLITLDHIWKQVSSTKNADGYPLEALVIPELLEIYIPRILFETLGVFQWFKHSFPNCVISFWEDDM